jgi:phosphoribosylanthranilate isomerase
LAATQLRERLDELRSSSVPFYIAGGIHADNVSELVMTLQPQGVDLSSGVELSPGIKDREKMIRFFEAMERVHL